jgi:hypothetical protein
VVLARIDPDVGDSVLQAAHARAVEPRLEDESEHIAADGALNLEGRLGLRRDREIPLAPEIERLQCDRDGLTMFVTEPQPQAAERIRGHRISLAVPAGRHAGRDRSRPYT